MRRASIFFILSLIILTLFTACSKTNDEDETVNDENKAEIKEEAADQSEDNNDTDGYKLKEDIGIYNGQADPHTIEIETAEGPTAFQLSDAARKDVAKLEENDEVIYIYYKKDDQLVIKLIEEYWYHREHHESDHHMERHQ